MDINHLTSLHELKSLPSLVELSANTNHIKELPERLSAGLMSSLPQSRLVPTADTVVKSCPPSAIKSSPALCALQKLELYHNRIAAVHPRALDEFGSLTYLDLGRNLLKSLDGRAIENCPALSTLILSQNCLKNPPFPMRLPLLTELWLSGNQISTMGQWATGLPKDVLFPHPEPRLNPIPRLERRNMLRENDELKRRLSTSMKATEGFVWLPSLVVLHLEDNAVDSLGGRWSLAGCPSLRFLDVSFNRLRTMDDITPCLKACGELRDVRLHDNPVSETGLCSDMVFLNCAKVTHDSSREITCFYSSFYTLNPPSHVREMPEYTGNLQVTFFTVDLRERQDTECKTFRAISFPAMPLVVFLSHPTSLVMFALDMYPQA